MAPTPSFVLQVVRSPNHLFGRHLHHLRRQGLSFPRHPARPPSAPRAEQLKARILLEASAVSLTSTIPPVTSSGQVALASAIPSNQPQLSSQPVDVTGNILAAVVVIVLILGGLVGLIIGGEMLRRRTRTTRKGYFRSISSCLGYRKSEPVKKTINSPQPRTTISREQRPYDEKTLTLLTQPPPALDKERRRRLSDIWPIRSLSIAMSNRRSCPVQVERDLQRPPSMPNPYTTWSEFTPVSLYVPPPRTVLTCIPEEREDCQSQANSDIEAILEATFQCSRGSGLVLQTNGPNSTQDMFLDDGLKSSATSDEDAKSVGSSTPDMTSDGGESSRSSMVSLESLEVGNESLGEEVFELRRAQTRSMQMNKGVLLSLSSKVLDDRQSSESTQVGCGHSRSSSTPDVEDGKRQAERDSLSLAMLGGSFSVVDLNEFPSLPSILPVIPSFVSSF